MQINPIHQFAIGALPVELLKRQKVYFSHPILTYRTEEENSALKYLRKLFPMLICPNTDISYLLTIEACLKLVRWSDAVVVMTNPKGYIGRGVYLEIKEATAMKKPVLILVKSKHYSLRAIKSVKVLDKKSWRKYARVS